MLALRNIPFIRIILSLSFLMIVCYFECDGFSFRRYETLLHLFLISVKRGSYKGVVQVDKPTAQQRDLWEETSLTKFTQNYEACWKFRSHALCELYSVKYGAGFHR